MAAVPLFLAAGDGLTAKTSATTAEAAERVVRATGGGSVTKTSDARADDTARTARCGETGGRRRAVFFLGRPEGVGAAVAAVAAAGERRRFVASSADAGAD